VVRPQLGWGAPNQALVDDALTQAAKHLPVLDAHLANRPFVLGDAMSFVDFAMASTETYRGRLPIDFDAFPNIQRHHDFIASLPAWQKALGKAPVAAAA
jgi:glutathione S-transferase